MSDPDTPQPARAPGVSPAARDDIQRAFLQSDREDLLAVLALRFGPPPEAVQARIAACASGETLERWILAAANVPDWPTFFDELGADPRDFKLVGARYEPIATPPATPGEPPEPQPPAGARPKEE